MLPDLNRFRYKRNPLNDSVVIRVNCLNKFKFLRNDKKKKKKEMEDNNNNVFYTIQYFCKS